MPEDTITLYRCSECGYLSTSYGWMHGHAEKHRGWGPFNALPPLLGNAEKLDGFVEELTVVVVDETQPPERRVEQ
jgi:hypothetical protein